jgi:hypothetical protein
MVHREQQGERQSLVPFPNECSLTLATALFVLANHRAGFVQPIGKVRTPVDVEGFFRTDVAELSAGHAGRALVVELVARLVASRRG